MQFVAKRTPPVPAALEEVTITLTGQEAKAICHHIYSRIPYSLTLGFQKTPEFASFFENLRTVLYVR